MNWPQKYADNSQTFVYIRTDDLPGQRYQIFQAISIGLEIYQSITTLLQEPGLRATIGKPHFNSSLYLQASFCK